MNELRLLQDDNPFLRRRLRQIFWATLLVLIAGVVNLTVFGANGFLDEEGIFGFRSDIVARLLGIGFIVYSYYLLSRGSLALAGSSFLWVLSLVIVFVTWMGGGLYSHIILCFPVILVFSALYTKLKEFLGVSVFLTFTVFMLGLNDFYGWYPPPEENFITGIPRMISGVLIIVYTSYISWVFGDALKVTIVKLKEENQQVNESRELIRKLAEFDVLTGLLNREAAREAFEATLKDLSPHESVGFYFIDLDNFKSINDLFDHHEGDHLLIEIACRLREILGDGGIACRLGGDEFIVCVRASQTFNFDGFAQKLVRSIAQPCIIFGAEVEVTASVGVAVTSQRNQSFDEVRKKADMAMHQAKQSGKNQYRYYSSELDKEYMRKLTIITGLKDAVSHELLELYYQPKINLYTHQIDGAEALLRWTNNNPDNIRPDEFIPVIESTEVIHGVGAWVIQQACQTAKHWCDEGYPIKMSVNVAAMQLTRASFFSVVSDALEAAGLAPEYLEIELTEHFLLNENPVVESQIAALKQLGVCLAIDDFGTGYSNMSYLTRLRVDVIKLDRCFISQITRSSDSLVIVTAVIQMAKVLRMLVVAEGVETEQEKALLMELGCDYGQGFLWSKAVPDEEFVTLLKTFSAKPF